MSAVLTQENLPLVLAGPLLRRIEARRLVFWLVATRPLSPVLRLSLDAGVDYALDGDACRVIAVGRQAFLHLIDLRLDTSLPLDQQVDYDLLIDGQGIADWAPHLLYGEARTATIAAPPAAAFEQVNDFHNWKLWSPWEKLDPNLQRTYDGPAAGDVR